MKKYIFLLLLTAFTFVSINLAPNVHAEAEAAQIIQEAEIEREKTLIKELTLNIPEQTEDPNYPITFIDPSNKGVDIVIDGKTITKAPSPFILPNLAIGEHTVAFSYKNASGEPRYLQKNMLITPKAPIFDTSLKTKIVRPGAVVLQGTALPQSTVMLVLNSNLTHSITTSMEGAWEFIVPEPADGDNNIIAFTIRNGIVSTPSKVFSFTYSLQENVNTVQTTTEDPTDSITYFFNTMLDKVDQNRKEDPMFFYGVLGIASLLLILLFGINMRKKAAKKRDEETIVSMFNKENKKESILSVISEPEEKKTTKKTSKKKKNTEKDEGKKKDPKLSKAFANLKEEMGVEEKKEKKEVKKKGSGLFSLFGGKNKEKSATKKTKTKEKEIPVPKPPKKEAIKEEATPKKEKETPVTKPSEKKEEEEKTIEKSDILSEENAPKIKTEKKIEKKKIKPEASPKKEPKKEKTSPKEKETVERIVDETEEPEKKVLTKEEFLKQFKSGDEES